MITIESIGDLVDNHRTLVEEIATMIRSRNNNIELFLFGSYAKGRVKNTSDIDVLMLTIDGTNKEERRMMRRDIMTYVEEHYDYEVELDLKVYDKGEFIKSTFKPGLEKAISKYMIRL